MASDRSCSNKTMTTFSRSKFRSSFSRKLQIGVLLVLLASWMLTAQGQLQVGYATIEVQEGAAPAAAALFQFQNDGIVISEAGVPATLPIHRGRIFVDQRNTSTGLALANPFDSPVEVMLDLRDSQGEVVAQDVLPLGPHQHVARFVNELFPQNGLAVGSLTFRVLNREIGIAAVTLRQASNSRKEAVFSTLPVADLAADSSPAGGTPPAIVFPHIGAGGILSTQIILINPTGQPISGIIRLFTSMGQPLLANLNGVMAAEFPFALTSNGTWEGTLTSASDLILGYAVVTSDESRPAPDGTAIFQFRDGQGELISEAGVGASRPTTTARISVDTIGTRTGVALASPGNSRQELRFGLLDRNGLRISEAVRPISAAGHLAIFADELFPGLPEGFSGLIEIESDQPIAPITLKLTVNVRGDLILTTLPIADIDQPPSGNRLVLAQVGFGEGFSSRFILIESALSKSSLELRFVQSNGEDLQVPLLGDLVSRFDLTLAPGGSRQLRAGSLAVAAQIQLNLFDPVPSAEIAINEGNQRVLRPLVIDSDGELRDDFEVSFHSIDEEIAAVDNLGRIQALQPGFSTLTMEAGGVVSATTIAVVGVNSGLGSFGINGIVQDLASRLYLANSQDHTILRSVSLEGEPMVYAGITQAGGFRDDERLLSLFQRPSFLALDQNDNSLFVSDSDNHVIRSVRPDVVSTFAGAGGVAGSADGSLESSRFNTPQGVALDPMGFLWVADAGNHTIRRIDIAAREVRTVAGLPGELGFQDGTGSESRFNQPMGLALVPVALAEQLSGEFSGQDPELISVVVADSGNGEIRRVWEDGRVEILAAPIPSQTSRRPAGRVRTPFENPVDVAIDPVGNVHVSEPLEGRVRTLLRTGSVVAVAEAATFAAPRGVAIGRAGQVLVADEGESAQQIEYGAPQIFGTGETPAIAIRVQKAAQGESLQIDIKGRNFSSETTVVLAGQQIGQEQVSIPDTRNLSFVRPDLASGKTTLTVQNRGGLAQVAFVIEPVPIAELPLGGLTTVAGGATFAGDGGSAVEASLDSPADVAVDRLGSLFIADSSNHRVRKVDPSTGVIITIAGTGREGDTGDGRLGNTATLTFPQGVAVHPSGEVFIADTSNDRVRVVSTGGIISTLLDEMFLSFPRDVAIGPEGRLFVVDDSHRVLRYDRVSDVVETFAGTGQPGDSGDGGSPLEATFRSPRALTFGPSGTLYIADSFNDRVRKIEDGMVSTVAGTGVFGFSGDGGPATAAQLNFPTGVAVDVEENLFIVDDFNQRVRRVDRQTGFIDTVAGDGDIGFREDNVPATETSLDSPLQAAVDGAGNLYIAGNFSSRIRRVEATTGLISTVAGNGQFDATASGFSGDGEDAFAATLSFPQGLDFDISGNLYIADCDNNRVRQVDGDGTGIITTVAGNGVDGDSGEGGPALEASLSCPADVWAHGSDLITIADFSNHRIKRVDLGTGLIQTVAGSGTEGDSGDGDSATAARLRNPSSIAVAGNGAIFIADSGNHRIRRVDPVTGEISTFAGDGFARFAGDGGPASQASFSTPIAVSLDSAEAFLYIADQQNNRVRRVGLQTQLIETIAGSGSLEFSGDGSSALSAGLLRVSDIILDGNLLYIATRDHHRVRRVDLDTLTIETIAGNGQNAMSQDGEIANQTGIDTPVGVAIDRDGNLFLSEFFAHRVRAVRVGN